MANLKLTLPDGMPICSGKQVTFKAPCNCSEIESIIINDVTYTLVDSNKNAISACGNIFSQDAYVSVLLDCVGNLAYVQNSSSGGGSNSLLIKDIIISANKFVTYTPIKKTEEEKLYNLGYTHKAVVKVDNAREVMMPEVTFSIPDLETSGVDIAGQINCQNGSIDVYATGVPANSITILTLKLSWNEALTDVENILTAEDVGAVAKSGGLNSAMTGDLYIQKNSPTTRLNNSETDSQVFLQNAGHSAWLGVRNVADESDNYRALVLGDSSEYTDPGKYIRFVDKVDGEFKYYKLYGEHNKPTVSDVGAAPAYTYGIEEMVVGEIELAAGTLYFMYEE